MDIIGVPNVEAERVARYEYDGLPALDGPQGGQGFRRIEKEVTANQGEGVVHHSDDGDITGILAGERHEHYYYTGWRLTETTNHVESAGSYSYDDSDVLNQFVYGTQYIDEPVRYDRNTDVGTDDDCLDASGSAAYFYHQDANWRVVMLTDEDGDVVERVEYTAYGEPTVYLGYDGTAGAELDNALLASTVGNPLLHQGLFRDRETLSYQNRFRQYHPRAGRFMQRDPFYWDHLTFYELAGSNPLGFLDPQGLQIHPDTRIRPPWRPRGLEYFPPRRKLVPRDPIPRPGTQTPRRPGNPDRWGEDEANGIAWTERTSLTPDGKGGFKPVVNCVGFAVGYPGCLMPLRDPGTRVITPEAMRKFIEDGLGCEKKEEGKSCAPGTNHTVFYLGLPSPGNDFHAVCASCQRPGGPPEKHPCDKQSVEGPERDYPTNDPPPRVPDRPGRPPKPKFGDYCCPPTEAGAGGKPQRPAKG